MENKENVLDYWQELYAETDPVKRELFIQCWSKRDKKKYGYNMSIAEIEELFSTHESALECILEAFDPEGLKKYRLLQSAA